MNTYEKTGEGGSPQTVNNPRSASPRYLSLVPTSLPLYFLTSRGESRASCYTVPPMARQRLGQHFLSDLHWREEIARAIRVSPHSLAPLLGDERSLRVPTRRDGQSLQAPLPKDDQHCWIEIGAGHGEITQHLLSTGAPVHAIEIDPAFIAGLRRLAKQFPNLTVVPGDVLETDIAAIASGRRIRIYGNLPYYITSPILHRLFNFADLIDEIDIVIQTEVAHRLAAEPGTRDYGYLSVVTQFYTRPEFVFEIPRDAFNPPPEITSALVALRLPGERAKLQLSSSMASKEGAQANSSRDAETHFLDFVKLCFSKKRKTLVNNLRSLAKPDSVREALAALTLRTDARAEQLSVSQLAALHVLLAGTR
jgi:16S rRNA (adenine1518-N6/adenine1519-N6)-dimethyltransferase